MTRNLTTMAVLVLLSGLATAGLAFGQLPCKPEDIKVPKAPGMLDADLGLVRDVEGQPSLPEWSKIEKLKSFYASLTASRSSCSPQEGADLRLRLFVNVSSLDADGLARPAGLFTADKSFQFYGVSRLRIERTDQEVTRQFALPVDGPAAIDEVVKGIETSELGTFLEDLAQLQLVMIPRVIPHPSAEAQGVAEGCFRVANISVVPTRVFEATEREDPAGIRPSLDARRRALEEVVRQTDWLRRIETEQPGCGTVDDVGYLDRQITSLNLTLRELIPDLDFMAEAVRFWNEVQDRIDRLRAEEQGWKKQLRDGRTPRP